MKILVPIDITSYTTNVPENDYPEFSLATTYAFGARVIIASQHNVYESIAGGNVGHQPTNGATDANWYYVGKTNAYKAIDDKVSTQTVSTSTITFEFPTLKSTALASLNMQCTSIKVEALNGTDVVYTETKSGRTRNTNEWYSYFFGEFIYQKLFLFEHQYNPSGTYRVTITGNDNKVGVMLRGNVKNFGCTLWNPSITPIDYSKYTIDQWGETYLKEGNFRLVARGDVVINTNQLSIVLDTILERRGKLSLYIPTTVLNFPAVYGYVREPQLVWQSKEKSVYTLDVQGVA